MAFKKSTKRFKKGPRPTHSVAFSARVRKGKYISGPSVGLWVQDGGKVMARGSVKEEYLTKLVSFLKKAEAKEYSVSLALFKNGKSKKQEDDEEEDEDGDEEETDEEADEDEDEWDLDDDD